MSEIILMGKSKLSTRCLSNVMYAILMCKAKLISSHGVGIYQYGRKQNSSHSYDFMISIDISLVLLFEELSGVKLKQPVKVHFNSSTIPTEASNE